MEWCTICNSHILLMGIYNTEYLQQGLPTYIIICLQLAKFTISGIIIKFKSTHFSQCNTNWHAVIHLNSSINIKCLVQLIRTQALFQFSMHIESINTKNRHEACNTDTMQVDNCVRKRTKLNLLTLVW